jgi:sortase A
MRKFVRMHRALRILSTTLITAGLVVFADVGMTLAWREPVSSIYGSIKQSQARSQLADLEQRFPSPADLRHVSHVRNPEKKIAALAKEFARSEAHTGQSIGRIEIQRFDLDAVLIQGTDTASLEKGPGHYPDTAFPGQGTTIGIAGHRTTYLAPFRHIDSLQPGDEIKIEMPYADFVYTVQTHRIVAPTETDIVDPVGYERLVLTACHPLYSASQRYAVFAKLKSEHLRSNSG